MCWAGSSTNTNLLHEPGSGLSVPFRVRVFALVDHYTAEAWAHVAKVGDRFAALQPVYDAVTDRWGQLGPDVARGLQLRHDWGP
jgi:hypothetical protein